MKTRAQKEAEAAAQQPQPLAAFSEESFAPGQVTVVSPDVGQPGMMRVQFFVGQLAPNLYVKAMVAQLDPDAAIAIGTQIVQEARLMKSGLVLASGAELPRAG